MDPSKAFAELPKLDRDVYVAPCKVGPGDEPWEALVKWVGCVPANAGHKKAEERYAYAKKHDLGVNLSLDCLKHVKLDHPASDDEQWTIAVALRYAVDHLDRSRGAPVKAIMLRCEAFNFNVLREEDRDAATRVLDGLGHLAHTAHPKASIHWMPASPACVVQRIPPHTYPYLGARSAAPTLHRIGNLPDTACEFGRAVEQACQYGWAGVAPVIDLVHCRKVPGADPYTPAVAYDLGRWLCGSTDDITAYFLKDCLAEHPRGWKYGFQNLHVFVNGLGLAKEVTS